ncbi:NAD(P)/FAD-dependent oxidoreductase [Caballeronia sordidicola]|uniref:NAD(P)/FAD-dependent oxidoreductase n=1 Tax=Caballeronia sordidicola TaxID=196367 RepID=UPI000550A79B|nr:FAD-dependent oxidoreductase [Caballeronia sordidicola]
MSSAESIETILIVGAGLAGVYAAEGMRQAGFDGRVILAGDEAENPYDRPPLSKKVLQDPEEARRIDLRDQTFYVEHEIELKLGSAAERIDRESQRVHFSGGTCVPYDKLLIATGSSLRTLPILPPGMESVFYLRRLADAVALRDALPGIRRLLVVGAGVIGLEVAAVASGLGIAVTVLEASARPMARATCPVLCDFIVGEHVKRHVDIRTLKTIIGVTRVGSGYRVALSDGCVIEADAIVVGVGVVPNIALAQSAGLKTSAAGIHVDGQGLTEDKRIYAAGEVAFHYNARIANLDRQENWHHAAAHGEHVGSAMVSDAPDYEEICGYWSDQYDFSVQSFGLANGERDVLRGDPATGSFAIFHVIDDAVRGVSSVNAARDMRAGKALVRAGARVPDATLSDPQTDLAKWRPTVSA